VSFAHLFPFPGEADSRNDIDAVLIMDSTGSMKETDPLTLRIPAAKLFISLLRDDDRVGVVSFSETARTLATLTRTATASGQKRLFKAVDVVNSRGQYTNIYEGIKKGFEVLESSPDRERMLILMSDGQMDLGDKGREEALLSDMKNLLLPEIRNAGVKIHTIAFSDYSDQKLLEEIATKTGGFYRLAKSDQDLHLAFSSIFEKIKSPDMLPMKGDSFSVDRDIQELILLITKKTPETAIIISDPHAKQYSAQKHMPDIQWFRSTVFDMITVKQPVSGAWNVKFSSGEGNKVFILTDLKLLSSFNRDVVTQGSTVKIDAWLEKDKALLRTKDVLEHIKLSAQIKPPDGTIVTLPLSGDGANNDTAARDGVYSGQVRVEQVGEYSIQLIAEGETFKRAKTYICKVVAPDKPAAVNTPVQRKEKEEEGLRWSPVLVRFGWVNIFAVTLVATAFLVRKLLKRLRGSQR
jgi:hypothetical protein